MQVFYQDEHLAVVCKPYGALSEAHESKPNMPAMLREELGCEAIYTVHRLDRITQGLMVYAKTAEAAKRLSAMMQKGEVEKIYHAVAEGIPDPRSGAMEDLLYFDRQKNKSYVVKRERRGVKQARLTYETLDTVLIDDMPVSLVKVRLHTGRTHQIRVQFASRKMPLAGDRRYGSRFTDEEIMLCSAQLRFTHPFTGEEMRFAHYPDTVLTSLFRQVYQELDKVNR